LGDGEPMTRLPIGCTTSSAIATTVLLEKNPTIRARDSPTLRNACGTIDGTSTTAPAPKTARSAPIFDLDLALLHEQDLLGHVDVTGSGLARLELDAEHRRARIPGRPEHREREVRLDLAVALDRAGVQLELVEVRVTSPRYRDILRPNGFRDERRFTLLDDGACWGWIALYRSGESGDFESQHAELAASLSQLLAEGLRRAILLAAVPTRRSAMGPA
jgi:hypothetical protein